jgi:heat shock protein HtpX
MLGARRARAELWSGTAWHGVAGLAAELGARAGLPRPPSLYWQPTAAVRAFSVGDATDPALALSEGALRVLPPRELRAVLAHEVAHLAAGDTRLLLLAETLGRVAQAVALVGLLAALMAAVVAGEAALPAPALLALALTPLAARLLTLGLSRRREFAADAAAARLTGDPEGLARALATIERLARRRWGHLHVRAAQSVPPALRTHPPTEERIARLLG